ncbi:30S ribosomal protein S9 [bacterium J17]|nr:30S ribosomal protein S9 [bacterium J17]
MSAARQTKALYATGRRKSASARVYAFPLEAKGSDDDSEAQIQPEDLDISVNNRKFTDYFPFRTTQAHVIEPLEVAERLGNYRFVVRVVGGGVSGQAGAVSHGIARVLEKAEPELRAPLKKSGLLTRDSRVVERKKPGRHKARKRPQFSKR